MRILKSVAETLGTGKLVIATIASSMAVELWKEYEVIFRNLGVRSLAHLNIESREQSFSETALQDFTGASGLFFTGGDQLKIMSKIGGTPVQTAIIELFRSGGTVAGTSAGATAVSELMLMEGECDPFGIDRPLLITSGLGLLKGVMI